MSTSKRAMIGTEGPACVLSWLENPNRLVNFWAMIEIVASELVSFWPNLSELSLGWLLGGSDIPGADELKSTLGPLINICRRLGWQDLSNQARRLQEKAQASDAGPGELHALAEDLRDALEEKIKAVPIAVVEERDWPILKNATLFLCGGALHSALAISEEEFNLAGRALALGLSTASVSHAMRSVEASLHVVANVLGISFPGPLQLQDWLNLTEKMSSEISKLEKQPRSQQKSDQLKLLSCLLFSADCFRLAWRNHVAHAREKYEYGEAHKVLEHVSDFLKKLSTTI